MKNFLLGTLSVLVALPILTPAVASAETTPTPESTTSAETTFAELDGAGWPEDEVLALSDDDFAELLPLIDTKYQTDFTSGDFMLESSPQDANEVSPFYLDYTPSQNEIRRCIAALGPVTCHDLNLLANVANARVNASYPVNTHHNGVGDAFRHCYWSGLMTMEFNAAVAATMGDIHEDHASRYGLQPPEEKSMDLFNNAFGRRVGDMYNDRESIARYCYQASYNGSLRTL
ncbi:DUF6973 domain-containing protein [Microbacterium esteraromaticum]|uniref:DUF6973 domain-containing protein n=1 Tax=Microbacterium esteraromaticum TaxID=57043 RepID=UPI000B35E7EA|nr:hypothetical protein [Microbacterium esteraromaticum]